MKMARHTPGFFFKKLLEDKNLFLFGAFKTQQNIPNNR